jgi:hypothetical protein
VVQRANICQHAASFKVKVSSSLKFFFFFFFPLSESCSSCLFVHFAHLCITHVDAVNFENGQTGDKIYAKIRKDYQGNKSGKPPKPKSMKYDLLPPKTQLLITLSM